MLGKSALQSTLNPDGEFNEGLYLANKPLTDTKREGVKVPLARNLVTLSSFKHRPLYHSLVLINAPKNVDISHEQEYPSDVLHPKADLEPLRPRTLAHSLQDPALLLKRVEYCSDPQLDRRTLPQ